MKTKTIPMALLVTAIWSACERKVDIAEFENQFDSYRPELKIEGLLQQDRPENSIIRIIRSTRVTDSEPYNGRDDDGDGLVDEEDEILAGVQDTSATVTVTNLRTGEATNFITWPRRTASGDSKTATMT